MHLLLQHQARQRLHAGVLQLPPAVIIGRQLPQIHRVRVESELVVLLQLLQILTNPDADEGVVRVREEIDEGLGQGGGVDELDYEAAVADAELQGGGGVADVAVEGRAPLDVEADDELVEAVAVEGLDVRDPFRDDLPVDGDGGVDGFSEEVDFVGVVRVVGKLVVDYGDRRRWVVGRHCRRCSALCKLMGLEEIERDLAWETERRGKGKKSVAWEGKSLCQRAVFRAWM